MAKTKIGNVYPSDEYLLARCAPTGFGLGGYCKQIDHWDKATACGWYSTANGSPTAATDSTIWVGEVTADPLTGQITQTVKAQGKDATYEAIRHFFDSRWSPWEWKNPPMEVGVEYRTTERYMGKPVYAKIVNAGAFPESGQRSFETGIAATGIVRFYASIGYTSLPLAGNMEINTLHSNGKIALKMATIGGRISGNDVYATFYYIMD